MDCAAGSLYRDESGSRHMGGQEVGDIHGGNLHRGRS